MEKKNRVEMRLRSSLKKKIRPLGPLDEVRRARRSLRKEMKRVKTEELSKLSEPDLIKRSNDLRSELSRLRSKAARGTLKKELGEIKTVRRNIARTLTAINAKKAELRREQKAPKKSLVPIPEVAES
jgi:large subunit ribosomal protein L29